jgi:hypothetical protein
VPFGEDVYFVKLKRPKMVAQYARPGRLTSFAARGDKLPTDSKRNLPPDSTHIERLTLRLDLTIIWCCKITKLLNQLDDLHLMTSIRINTLLYMRLDTTDNDHGHFFYV